MVGVDLLMTLTVYKPKPKLWAGLASNIDFAINTKKNHKSHKNMPRNVIITNNKVQAQYLAKLLKSSNAIKK